MAQKSAKTELIRASESSPKLVIMKMSISAKCTARFVRRLFGELFGENMRESLEIFGTRLNGILPR